MDIEWIDAKRQLPEKEKDDDRSVEVIVSLKDEEVSMDRYNHKYNLWLKYGRLVTHWSYKPSPAKDLL